MQPAVFLILGTKGKGCIFRGNKNMSIDSIAQIQYHFHEDFQSPTPLGLDIEGG